MYEILDRFIERLNDSHEPTSFQQAMAEAAFAFELPCFAYLRMPRDGKSLAALISNYPPAWTQHYLNSHFERLDPVIQVSHTQKEPFEWGLGAAPLPLTDQQLAFFDEARFFGICCGFTIPIQDCRGSVAAVTFASDIQKPAFRHSVRRNRDVLQMMALSLHAHVRRKLWLDPTLCGMQDLSPRQFECLKWAAAGKSIFMVGQILGIKRRTAEHHLEEARRKLGADNLRDACAMFEAVRRKL